MRQTIDRRDWLKQAALTIGSLSIAPHLVAGEMNSFHKIAAGPIRLHANENPYGPCSLARKAMADAIASSNLYPWETTTLLREKIASHFGLTKENVLMGAGSSEILGIVAQYAGLKNGNAITADPTFGIWFTAAQKSGLDLIKVPLTKDKKHDLQRMKEKVDGQTRLFYICNPNNPTGTVLPPGDIKDVIAEVSRSSIVLLDEAYTEYSDEPSLAALVKYNPNLVIAKTFSKIYGMAGARIGYALAHAGTIQQLNEMQPWANAGASAVSLAGALASLDDHSFVKMSKTKNAGIRRSVTDYFDRLGIPYIPSHTNFIYYSLKDQKTDLLAALANQNIRAGRLSGDPEKWTRISIGTLEEMKQFSEIVTQSFKS